MPVPKVIARKQKLHIATEHVSVVDIIRDTPGEETESGEECTVEELLRLANFAQAENLAHQC